MFKNYFAAAALLVLIVAASVSPAKAAERLVPINQFGATQPQKGGYKFVGNTLYQTNQFGAVQYQKGAYKYKSIDDVIQKYDKYGKVQVTPRYKSIDDVLASVQK